MTRSISRHRRLLTLSLLTATTALVIGWETDVIYGPDDRKDVYEVGDPGLLGVSQATVGLFRPADVQNNGNGTYDLATDPYNVCPEEPFSDQPTSAFCSGFLVEPDVLVTAGHCVTSQASCNNTRFVFGFQMADASTPITTVSEDDVYSCDTLVASQASSADYAVIVLDRPVVGRTPVTLRTAGTVSVDDPVGVAGHPSGLPQKIAGGAVVRDVNADYFVANLDTYGGNSGSPVFNLNDFTVEGILVRGAPDFVSGPGCGGCQVSNECPDTGCRGEDVTNAITFAGLIP